MVWEYSKLGNLKYKNFRFQVEIEGFTEAGFTRCEGLSSETAMIPFRHGDGALAPYNYPGMVSYGEVTLTTGLAHAFGAFEILNKRYNHSDKINYTAETRYLEEVKIISLEMGEKGQGYPGNVKQYFKIWTLKDSLIRRWSLGDYDASDSDIIMESLVLKPTSVSYSVGTSV